MATIQESGGASLPKMQRVLLQRPLPLLCNSLLPNHDTELWQADGAEAGPLNLQQLAGGQGLEGYLQQLGHAKPPADLQKVLQRFELHALLHQPTA